MADPTKLREALGRTIYGTDPAWEDLQPRDKEYFYSYADAIIAALPEHRDDVLAVLGVKPWGHWYEDDTPGRECNHGDRDGCSRSDHASVLPLYIARPKEQP